MRIEFWTWSKKPNSTAVPGSPDTTQNIDLKSPCSVESPVIVLRNGGGVPGWNYCRIPGFSGRYYWIDNWTYEDNCWIGELSVDVLGTYRGTIGSTSYYVLRSSTSFDTNIVDMLYPLKALPQKTRTVVTDGMFQIAEYGLSQGYYVCGIVGQEGLTNFYAFTPSEFRNFCTQIFANIDWAQSDGQQISNSLLKCLFNPFQYITSCMWMPVPGVGSGTSKVTGIKFGFWEVTVSCAKLGNRPVYTRSFTMPVKNHPQISRGNYLNSSPFRRISVEVNPWGRFSIDSGKVGTENSITVSEYIDCMSGVGYLSINNSSNSLITSYTQIGVPVQISDIKNNIVGSAGSLASSIGNVLSGNFMGALSGIGNAVNNMIPSVDTRGANGCLMGLVLAPVIDIDFYTVADEDRADNGRPLMKNGTFATLGSGYYVVENGSTSLRGATKMELDKVKSFLESGVYYQ